MSLIQCKYHPEARLIEDYTAGDLICMVCGLVVGDRVIDYSSEWRSFANDGDGEDNSRVGAKENNFSSNTATSITIKQSFDSRHLDENGEQKYKNRMTVSPTDRMIKQCRDFITTFGDRLNLDSNTKNAAMEIVKRLTEIQGFTRKNKAEISAACLFYVCRHNNIERSYKEIAAVAELVTEKVIGKMYKRIVARLGLASQSSNIVDGIPRFCCQLKIKDIFVQKLAMEITKSAQKFLHKKPLSVVTAAIYMSCLLMGEKITKKCLKELIGVTESTIAITYKVLHVHRNSLIPDSMISRLKIPINSLPLE